MISPQDKGSIRDRLLLAHLPPGDIVEIVDRAYRPEAVGYILQRRLEEDERNGTFTPLPKAFDKYWTLEMGGRACRMATEIVALFLDDEGNGCMFYKSEIDRLRQDMGGEAAGVSMDDAVEEYLNMCTLHNGMLRGAVQYAMEHPPTEEAVASAAVNGELASAAAGF